MIFQAELFGGTFLLTQELKRIGVAISFARTVDEFAAEIRPETRVIYVESPSNPLLRVVNLDAIAQLGRAHGVLTVADNTFATPINQNPLASGIDVVIHSATKYLNGHSDLNAGFVVASRAVIARVTEYAVNHGGMLDAHACFLLERALKTLALRVKQHNDNATALIWDVTLNTPANTDYALGRHPLSPGPRPVPVGAGPPACAQHSRPQH